MVQEIFHIGDVVVISNAPRNQQGDWVVMQVVPPDSVRIEQVEEDRTVNPNIERLNGWSGDRRIADLRRSPSRSWTNQELLVGRRTI